MFWKAFFCTEQERNHTLKLTHFLKNKFTRSIHSNFLYSSNSITAIVQSCLVQYIKENALAFNDHCLQAIFPLRGY